MNTSIAKKSDRNLIHRSPIIFAFLYCIPFQILAEGKDLEVFNQFYQEIVNSSTAGCPGKIDSIVLPGTSNPDDHKAALPLTNGTDAVSEHLKKEMENILKDAQLRHSDAIKFMQEAK